MGIEYLDSTPSRGKIEYLDEKKPPKGRIEYLEPGGDELETAMQTEAIQRETAKKQQFLQEEQAKQEAAKPENWSMKQTKEYLKENESQTPEQDVQAKKMIADKKEQEKEIEGAIGKQRLEAFVQNISKATETLNSSVGGFGKDAWNSFNAGLANLWSNASKAPAATYDLFAMPQNFVAKAMGRPDLQVQSPDWLFNNAVSKKYEEIQDYYTKSLPKKSFEELWQEKDIPGISRHIALKAIENAPQQIGIIGSYMAGVPGAGLAGAGALAGIESLKENRDQDPAMATYNALSHAVIESGFESIGTMSILKNMSKSLAKSFGKETARKVMFNVGKTIVASAFQEGIIEEIPTSLAQDFSDYVTGMNPDAMKGSVMRALESGLVGMVSGGALVGPAAIKTGYNSSKTHNVIKRYEDAVKESYQEKVAKINAQKEGAEARKTEGETPTIEEADKAFAKKTTPEEQKKIDELKSSPWTADESRIAEFKKMVEDAGGKFHSIQQGSEEYGAKGAVQFDDPNAEHGSTMALHFDKVTPEAIKERMAKKKAEFREAEAKPDLAQEAKKYKTAEEFVESQVDERTKGIIRRARQFAETSFDEGGFILPDGTPIERLGVDGFETDHDTQAVIMAGGKDKADSLRNTINAGIIRNKTFGNTINIEFIKKPTTEQMEAIKKASVGRKIFVDISTIDKEGGVASGEFNTFEEFDSFVSETFAKIKPATLDKAQLTDIWNKAQPPAKPPVTQEVKKPPEPEGKTISVFEPQPLKPSKVKAQVREATGVWKVDDLFISDRQALKILMQREQMFTKQAKSIGTAEGIKQEKIRKAKVLEAMRERKMMKQRYNKALEKIKRYPRQNIDPKYKKIIVDVKEGFDLKRRSKNFRRGLEATYDYAKSLREKGELVNVPDYRMDLLERWATGKGKGFETEGLRDVKSINDMNVTEMEELAGILETLNNYGRTTRKLKEGQAAREHEATIERLNTQLDKTAKKYRRKARPDLPVGVEEKKSKLGKAYNKVKDSLYGYLKHQIRGERLLDTLDGYQEYKGPHVTTIKNKLEVADRGETRMYDNTISSFEDFLDKEKIDLIKIIDDKHTIRGKGEITGAQKIGVYLYSLNENTTNRILYGNKYTSEELADMADSLTEDEKKIANWLLKHYQKQRPAIAEIYEKETGNILGEEENYSPAVSEYVDSSRSYTDELLEEMEQRFHVKMAVEKGMTIDRVKNVRPLQTDALQNFYRNAGQAAHYVNYALPIKEIRRIMSDEKYYSKIRDYRMEDVYKEIDTWLKDTASKNPGISVEEGWRWMIMVRHNNALGLLGYNAITAPKQIASFLSGATYHGLPGILDTTNSLGQYIAHPLQLKQFVDEKSPYMKTRMVERDIRQIAEKLAAEHYKGKDKGVLRGYVKHSMDFIRAFDTAATTPLWKGRYDKVYKETKGDEQKAISEADGLIQRTQPSARVMDLPQYFRGGGLSSLFSQFMNQLNNNLNVLAHDVVGYTAYNEAPLAEKTHIAASRLAGITLQMLLVASIGRLALPRNAKQVFKDLAGSLLGMFVFFGTALRGWLEGYESINPPAVQSVVEGTTGLAELGVAVYLNDPEKLAKAGLKTAEALARTSGIPITQPIRTFKGAYDLVTGRTTDWRRLIISQYALNQGTPEGEFKDRVKSIKYHYNRHKSYLNKDLDEKADKYLEEHPEIELYEDVKYVEKVLRERTKAVNEIVEDKSMSRDERIAEIMDYSVEAEEAIREFMELIKEKP